MIMDQIRCIYFKSVLTKNIFSSNMKRSSSIEMVTLSASRRLYVMDDVAWYV